MFERQLYILIHEKISNTVTIVVPEFKACDEVIKKYKKLNFILNTHHHADHVGANLELKKKYNSKILGSNMIKIVYLNRYTSYRKSKTKNWKFRIRSNFCSGHTKGHIAFFFSKEKLFLPEIHCFR